MVEELFDKQVRSHFVNDIKYSVRAVMAISCGFNWHPRVPEFSDISAIMQGGNNGFQIEAESRWRKT